MARTLFTLMLIATLGLCADAQDNPAVSAERAVTTGSGSLPFCPPKTCLYYAGDFNSADPNANGLLNSNYAGILIGQVWVGVKPTHDATVTGATFNEFSGAGTLTNPTPFAVQVGIKPGQAGKTICSTSGTATMRVYEQSDSGPNQYSFTIKKLSPSCKLKKGRVYYVNLLPTSDDAPAYVTNVEDRKPKYHYGWKNDLNHCYFNGTGFGDGYNYVTCNSQGAFNEFSIALTGKVTK